MSEIKKLISEVRKMARKCTYLQYGESDKKKLNSKDFERMILQSAIKGMMDTTEHVLKMLEEPGTTVDLAKGDLHILRLEIWEAYRTTNFKARKLDLTEMMKVEVDNNLIYRGN